MTVIIFEVDFGGFELSIESISEEVFLKSDSFPPPTPFDEQPPVFAWVERSTNVRNVPMLDGAISDDVTS